MVSTQQEIIDIEKDRMRAMVSGDLETLDSILSADLTYIHTSAALDTKESILDGIKSGRLRYTVMDASEVSVKVYGEAAVITGLAKVEVSVSGRDLKFELKFTDVYINGSKGWQMVAWQSTRTGN